MNETLQQILSGLKLGTPQAFHNFTLFPLLDRGVEGVDYLTLGAALKLGLLSVVETSGGGSVPELKVVNRAEKPVLILDGEELMGSKQNRVLNTTVLLKPSSETIIDVSCTEHGRWHYESAEFADSEVVMARGIRAMKNRSVSESVRSMHQYRSDQSGIWDKISELNAESGVHSETGAMRDAFVCREEELRRCEEVFTVVDGQTGFIFVVDGAVAGMDLVSRADAYAQLHGKLVRSYVIDSPLKAEATPRPVPEECVRSFLALVLQCDESSHPSVGLGVDWRYEHREVAGSALILDDICVHAAFFPTPPGESASDPGMSGIRRRRGFLRTG
ncbi:MAG: hypothetical protein H3C30_07165 [Candidatus Hydrogenedentes bacterium]|nr:hypothetical protein [Candidatus Hydrogenedentota bacterium]